MGNETVIAALQTALESNPDDIDIRIHLGSLLLEDGIHADAQRAFEKVLSTDPANIKALKGANQCALALGDNKKANGYGQLLSALSESPDDDTNILSDSKPTNDQKDSTVSLLSDKRAQQKQERAKLKAIDKSDNVTQGSWDDKGPVITLKDVGGMEHVKKRLNTAFLGPLKNPELMKMYGKTLNGGLLLYGPPGCGKTFIARALAGELGAKFISIGLADVLDMWLGESERKLHEIFEMARRNAPAVLFFDEIDALGQKRSHQRNSGGRNIVNQLLAEMDSVGTDNRNVFILAATNHPWDVDTALRRPGRFDRVVLVLPPDKEARESILKFHTQDRPVEKVDLIELAEQTDLFSGADLAHLADSAVELALEDSVTTGTARPINQADFDSALKEIKSSTRAWLDTAKNYAMFANEDGVYDELLGYIRMKNL